MASRPIASVATPLQLAVGTWNVGGCRVHTATHGTEDVAYFAEAIRAAALDIVLLQEVHVYDDGTSQAEFLAEVVGLPFSHAHACSESHLDERARLGLALISRYPITAVEYWPLPTPALTAERRGTRWTLFPRGILTARAQLPGLPVSILCAHAHPFHHFGRDALDADLATSRDLLDSKLASLSHSDLVAGIDLNDGRYSQLLPRSLSHGIRNVFRAPTTPDGVQQDFVFYAGSLVMSCWTVQPTQADHHLCYARFATREA